MKVHPILTYAVVVLLQFHLDSSSSQTNPAPPPDPSRSRITKVNDTLYTLGTLKINTVQREITVPGEVNMQTGVIELLACGPIGKRHESVFVIHVVPSHLHTALVLLGLESGGGLEFQGDPRRPKGDSVEVWVQWQKGDTTVTVRGEDCVWDIPESTMMKHTPWVFSGSRMFEGTYVADVEQSLITTYHDPNTILDNPMETGGNDELYRVNEHVVPPVGTPVLLKIRSLKSIHRKGLQ